MEYARFPPKGQRTSPVSPTCLICVQGDLTELLGEVPVYNPEWSDNPPLTSIPPLPADGKHPYHLVVMYLPFSLRSPSGPDFGPQCRSGMPNFIRCDICVKDIHHRYPERGSSQGYQWG